MFGRWNRNTLAKKPLGTNLEDLRADFESVTGKPFEHFYCPIMLVDEDAPLMKGHIVPESLGGKSRVVQRSDIDHGFGSFFEAEAGDAVLQGLDTNPFVTYVRGDAQETRELRRFKKKIQIDGTEETINVSIRMDDGQLRLFPKSQEDFNAVVGELSGPTEFSAQLGFELDSRSSILVTSLRTSHLGWFRKCGYRSLFTPEGIFVAAVLREFYKKIIEPRFGPNVTKKGSLFSDDVKREVDELVFPFANFMRPWPSSMFEMFPEELQRGSMDSGLFIALLDGNQVYGRISVVKFGNQHIGVMTPTIIDARCRAMFDLAEHLKLDISLGRWNEKRGVFEADPPTGRTLLWPSANETDVSKPWISIREAIQVLIRTGRWNDPTIGIRCTKMTR